MTNFLVQLLERYIFKEGVSKDFLVQNRGNFARLAQEVYDDWDEENVDEFAGGGICHLIADAICDFLQEHDVDCVSMQTCVGENHTFVVVKTDDGVFEIDIPPSVYETGGGYSWEKIDNVKFEADDIVVNMLDRDPESFDDYAEDL